MALEALDPRLQTGRAEEKKEEEKKADVSDLIKEGAKTDAFANCNVLGWQPAIDASFVKICPNGIKMGAKMFLYFTVKPKVSSPYYVEGKDYDLASFKVEVFQDWSFLILVKREVKQPKGKVLKAIDKQDVTIIKSFPDDFMSPENLED